MAQALNKDIIEFKLSSHGCAETDPERMTGHTHILTQGNYSQKKNISTLYLQL